jgi:hypothetical protein
MKKNPGLSPEELGFKALPEMYWCGWPRHGMVMGGRK